MKKILYIEDDKDQLSAFTRFIDKQKFIVLTESDPLKAIEVIIAQKPDLILLDIIMNNLSGLDILEQIRADKTIRDIPVIFLTNQTGEELAKDARRLGALTIWEKTKISPKTIAEKSDSYLREGEKNSKRILMIDDDQIATDMYSKKLVSYGFTVFVEHDPTLAYKRIIETNPDLVLLDIMMPKMNGAQVLAQIRSHEDMRYLPIVVLSSVADFDEIEPMKSAGGYTALWNKVNLVPSTLVLKIRDMLGV